MAGIIGRIALIVAFVSTIISGIAYLRAARAQKTSASISLGRTSWIVQLAALIVASVVLSYLIFSHQFQYNYVWSNSSKDLPAYYLFSAFWAGQEGSFLLWTLFTGVVGLIALRYARSWEGPVMTVVAFSHVFMISMIVGLKLGPLEIGSSPFGLLAERFPDAPFLAAGGIPPDGNGLNDLLQNYWMVIHPPTLFLGFTTMIVPFAYAVAGLWKRQYTQWVRPALPWILSATLILLIGITMGGYWAYVTLSFGGYWAWDPVENSSFVPFLIGAAALHTMVAQKKSGTSHKASILLCVATYITVIYSTFLTRSGILGDVSVHSFVDLGLYNQLLLWILAIAIVGIGLFAARYRELPTPRREPEVMSREFMIFTGAMVLCAIAVVILVGTSTPIIGRLFRENPSGVPVEFYNKWTLPMAVIMMILVGLGQLFWWTRMSIDNLNRLVVRPLVLSVASTAAVLMFTPFASETAQAPETALMTNTAATMLQAGVTDSLANVWSVYGTGILLLLLLFTSFFAFYGNSFVLWKIGRGNFQMAGGAVAHIGLAIALLGIITSSGMNDPITNSVDESRQNFVVTRGEPVFVDDFVVTYSGTSRTDEGYTAYNLVFEGEDKSFTVDPVAYKSRQEQWIQHPDIEHYLEKDIYVSVAPRAMFENEAVEEASRGEFEIARGEVIELTGSPYRLRFDDFQVNTSVEHVEDGGEISVSARLIVTDTTSGEQRQIAPTYIIDQDRKQKFLPAGISDWGITISFVGMRVDDGSIRLVVDGIDVQPEDWIVVQAYHKPFINLLWFGIMLMSVGFLMAIYRRYEENRYAEERLS